MLENLGVDTKLMPGIFKQRYDLNKEYLMSLKSEALLQNFYLEAGIMLPGYQVLNNPDTEDIHWGWESPTCQLRGHFLGHWLSAASMIYYEEKDASVKAKLDHIIEELAYCQRLNGGEWVGSIPEKYFTKLEKGESIWSPQYTMHKTVMGLVHAYLYAKNKKALTVVGFLSDWYLRWTDRLLSEHSMAMYKGEEGGMLEMWALLYEITSESKYMILAKRYQNPGLFDDLLSGKDPLSNCHTNSSIPWAHGAAKMYEVTGDEKWKKITESFWKCAVLDRGYYCTGGQSAGEFWIPPHRQGHYLSSDNQEFCTVYNMIRLASYLYQWSGKKEFSDYIELNLYNGVLAQQNMNTGMPTYFLPLQGGSNKKWGSRTRDFWCCYGTMVQAQTMYQSLIYYKDQNRLYVSQYIPSFLTCNLSGSEVTVTQETHMKYYNDTAYFDEKDDSQMSRWSLKLTVRCKQSSHFLLSLRIPDWISDIPELSINGAKRNQLQIENGYINIEREWQNDEIILYFPTTLCFHALDDLSDTYAVMEGPIVLAGLCDEERRLIGDNSHKEKIFSPRYEHTYRDFPWKQNTYKTCGQIKNIEFIPLYEVTDQKYTVYFEIGK